MDYTLLAIIMAVIALVTFSAVVIVLDNRLVLLRAKVHDLNVARIENERVQGDLRIRVGQLENCLRAMGGLPLYKGA